MPVEDTAPVSLSYPRCSDQYARSQVTKLLYDIRITEEALDHDLVEQDRAEPFGPDPVLFLDRLGLTHLLDVLAHTREEEGRLSES